MFCFLLKQCLISFLNIHRIFFCTHNPLFRPDCLELRACFCPRVLGLEACVTLPACLWPFNGCTLEERGGKEKVFPSTMNVYLLFFKNIFSVSICIYVYVGCWQGHVYMPVCVFVYNFMESVFSFWFYLGFGYATQVLRLFRKLFTHWAIFEGWGNKLTVYVERARGAREQQVYVERRDPRKQLELLIHTLLR